MLRSLALGLLTLSLTGAEWPDVPDPIGLGPRLATIDWLQERQIMVPADATDEAIIELWAEASGLRAQQREEEARLAEAAALKEKAERDAKLRRESDRAMAQARANERVRERAEPASVPAPAEGVAGERDRATAGAASTTAATAAGNAPTLFPDNVSLQTKADIVAFMGPPDASYVDGGTEHLLYAKVFLDRDGEPYAPDFLLKDDQHFQRTYIPPDIMVKDIAAAKRFAGWVPPQTITVKTFSILGKDMRGYDYAKVLATCGEPDVKRVFGGNEIWVYRKVPYPNGEMLSLYFTFDNGVVVENAGN